MSHETVSQVLQLATAALVLGGGIVSFWNRIAIRENTTITKEACDTAKETHDIANGGYTLALDESARRARRIATLTGRPEDLADAILAERIVSQRLESVQYFRSIKTSNPPK